MTHQRKGKVPKTDHVCRSIPVYVDEVLYIYRDVTRDTQPFILQPHHGVITCYTFAGCNGLHPTTSSATTTCGTDADGFTATVTCDPGLVLETFSVSYLIILLHSLFSLPSN